MRGRARVEGYCRCGDRRECNSFRFHWNYKWPSGINDKHILQLLDNTFLGDVCRKREVSTTAWNTSISIKHWRTSKASDNIELKSVAWFFRPNSGSGGQTQGLPTNQLTSSEFMKHRLIYELINFFHIPIRQTCGLGWFGHWFCLSACGRVDLHSSNPQIQSCQSFMNDMSNQNNTAGCLLILVSIC